ncbi:TetR/AcrR family transcriptional regulator [Serinicoccus sediminis]|uniref:TetR/AcrR family transcriptional regulator n=1 Tax=Serinicoccus sediminis TaxID=2306021 RepID=UPI00102073F0|nr:TetR/AcrR family transcriptional regulator [Serinicoccus sediminis]
MQAEQGGGLSTPGPSPRNARGLATARRLHRSAVRVATTAGLEALTVDAVCADAGVSQRTFFHHFPTKDDALLGLELPAISQQRAQHYLSDPDVPILAGAVALIDLPAGSDPATQVDQLRLLARSPQLQARQAERFQPILGELRVLVRLKLEASARADGRRVDTAELDEQSDLVTALGAALVHAAARRVAEKDTPSLPDLAAVARPLLPIWDRLV